MNKLLNKNTIKDISTNNWIQYINYRELRNILRDTIQKSTIQNANKHISYNVKSPFISLVDLEISNSNYHLWFSFADKRNENKIIIGTLQITLNELNEIKDIELLAHEFNIQQNK